MKTYSSFRVYRRTLVVTLLWMLASSAWAAPVDPLRAERVARHFWNSQRDKETPMLTAPMRCRSTQWDAFYIFESDEATGFVIVSADDAVQPVLGYSFCNAVMGDAPHRELAWWLNGYQQQIDYCRTVEAKPMATVAADWNQWESESLPAPAGKAVSPLLTTQWDQGNPYNQMCPTATVNNRTVRAVTGCVATAMAQVMRYWSHPLRGTGSHTYTPAYFGGASIFGTQSADFGNTVYDWDNMPDHLASTSSDAERQAVALLMYHCGVAVDMQYGTSSQGGSGAFVHNMAYLNGSHTLNGMVNFFGYSSHATALMRKDYENSEWQNIVRTELRAHRPVLYAGGDPEGGHCFVCDGYGGLGYFHINWGWGGVSDGDFTLNNLAPGTGGIGGGNYSFNDDQEIIVGLQPHGDDDSLCFIREFPYYQDFETAPTCWSAEDELEGETWKVRNTNGVDGNYSVYVSAPQEGGSEDHLYSPYICAPGHYKLSWQAHSVGANSRDYYTVSTHTLLLADTLRGTDWVERETTFDIAEGDTVSIDFHYTFTGGSTGVMIDHIAIEQLWDAAILNSALNIHHSRVYPNPTRGSVYVDSEEPLLQVDVLDICGRRLQTGVSPTMRLAELPTGIYFLRVTTPSGTETHRLTRIQ